MLSKILLNTKTFQASSRGLFLYENNYVAQGHVFRRMNAYQIWDSLEVIRLGTRTDKIPLLKYTSSMPKEELLLKQINEVYKSVNTDQMGGKIRQREYHGTSMGRKTTQGSQNLFSMIREKAPTKMQMKKAQKSFYKQAHYIPSAYISFKKKNDTLFLESYGLPSRDVIESHAFEANIPQALLMMNSDHVNKRILSSKFLRKNFQSFRTLDSVLMHAYLFIFSREPSVEEKQLWQQYYNDVSFDQNSYREILWTLINSREFLFIE